MAEASQKINFQTAMEDFKNMFPHLENSLIEQVLRRNNGMVDQTIDDLLAISCVEEDQPRSSAGPSNLIDNQNQLLRPIQQAPASASRTYPTLSRHLPPGDLTLTPRSQQPPHQKYGQVPVTFLGVQFKIPYVDPLPQQFLRLSEPPAPAQDSPLAAQMSEDREFALLLHNEDFLDQMQSNQEFMRTLNQAERGGISTGAVEADSSEVGFTTSASFRYLKRRKDKTISDVDDENEAVAASSSSRRSEDGSIAQRLSETGRATRSKLLKIAHKLDWRRSTSSGSSKQRQPLLNEDDDEEGAPLFEEQGDDGLIFSDMEEAEEEMKTIPRQNTLQEFEDNRQRARDAVARQFRGERPPPPPIPPPGCPSSSSTMSQDDFFSTSGTLTDSRVAGGASHEPALLNFEDDKDNIYEDDLVSPLSNEFNDRPSTPIYASTDEMHQDTVSNMTLGSETSSVYDCDVRNREIHSATLSSSYLIPIRTFPDEESERYDNINTNLRPKEDNLIKF
ncbi:CUE domain-containing protein 1-like isoform X2 [Bolinopsis microptera]|uniref:CUE domain-containing protein 1-like isoform X2 n=1 Tax=Bolinopsis microptera TaxID=2820187 RepID=UPI0030793DDF